MMDNTRDEPRDAPLNPALKSATETVYETKVSSRSPIDTTSAKENQGEGWPVVWLVVTAVGIAFALYFLL